MAGNLFHLNHNFLTHKCPSLSTKRHLFKHTETINRIGAYVIGSRATQKCMLQALLEPLAQLRQYEANGQGFQRLALLEECKSLPWNAVWDMFCLKNNVPVGESFIAEVEKYEAEVTSKR